MTDAQTPAPTPVAMRAPTGEPELKGIGGWLILPIVHLVLNSGLIVYQIVVGVLQALPQVPNEAAPAPSASAIYDALTAGQKLAIALLLFSIFIVLYATFCLIQFLRKKRQVPTLMIFFYLFLAVMTAGNYYLLSEFPSLAESPDDLNEAIMGLVRVGVALAVWIPYFLVSERVKNTFVN